MGDSDVVELGDFKNKLTESVGYIMYGTYNFTAVVVILNMLIAMMSESYETTKVSDCLHLAAVRKLFEINL